MIMEMFSKERTQTKNPLIVCYTGGSINLNFIVLKQMQNKKVLSETTCVWPDEKIYACSNEYLSSDIKIGPIYR